jgi:hypothetical protein
MRNACFGFPTPPILASRIHPKNMFFQDAFLDTLSVDFIGKWFILKTLQTPAGTKLGPQIDQVGKDATLYSKPVIPKRVPENALHFWCTSVALWLTFGALLVAVGSILLSLLVSCLRFLHAFSTYLWTEPCKTCPHPPIKLMQQSCQDPPRSLQICYGLRNCQKQSARI